MHLVLTAAADPEAAPLLAGLQEAGLDVTGVTAEALAEGQDWTHEVTSDGAWFTVRLPDGRELDSRKIMGTVNRVQYALPARIAAAPEVERSYAEQEFSAFLLSVLACLPGPVLNPPTPQGLSGAIKHPSELVWRAAQSGLPVLPYVFDARSGAAPAIDWASLAPPGAPVSTIYAVGPETVGEAPPALRAGVLALAQDLGLPFLGADFLALPGRRAAFVGASPVPPLAPGGAALIAAIARALDGSEAAA